MNELGWIVAGSIAIKALVVILLLVMIFAIMINLIVIRRRIKKQHMELIREIKTLSGQLSYINMKQYENSNNNNNAPVPR